MDVIVTEKLPWLVGLSGYGHSGKDTVAKYMEKYGYKRVAFADLVREAALAIDPYVFDEEHFERLGVLVSELGWDEAKALPDVRRLLQRIGTEMGRNMLGDDFWIEKTYSRHMRHAVPGERYVISDMRFPNEARWVRYMNGTVIRVVRPDHTPLGHDHASENSLDDTDLDGTGLYDLYIHNDGTLEDLEAKVDKLFGGKQ